MPGLRSVPVESQFWADFARQSPVSPSAEAPKPGPTVKPLSLLVPTDLSPASFPAVDCALAIARQHAARVILLHAIHLSVTPFGPARAARLKTSLCQEALAKAGPILTAAREMGITAVCLLPEGRPAAMIAEIAGQCGPGPDYFDPFTARDAGQTVRREDRGKSGPVGPVSRAGFARRLMLQPGRAREQMDLLLINS